MLLVPTIERQANAYNLPMNSTNIGTSIRVLRTTTVSEIRERKSLSLLTRISILKFLILRRKLFVFRYLFSKISLQVVGMFQED